MENTQGKYNALSLIGLVLFVMLLLNIYSLFMKDSDIAAKALKSDAVQSVFLTNGQVYFGDVTSIDAESMILENVYYIQVDEALGQAANAAELSLVKLGPSELHKPEDKMVISRDQILFWENLTADSEVVKAMENFDGEVTPEQETAVQKAADEAEKAAKEAKKEKAPEEAEEESAE